MMSAEFSPEEKLLNLIKRKKKMSAYEDQQANINKTPAKETTNKMNTGIDLSTFFGADIAKIGLLRRINFLFFTILIFIFIYLIVDIIIPAKNYIFIEEEVKETSHPIKGEDREVEKGIEVKPYSYYAKSLNKNIFKQLVRETQLIREPSIPIEDLMSDFLLLGIVSGENPQAIIEDKKQNRTFFLKEGQSAAGIYLKKIEDGSVTVVYKGKEFVLSL